MKTHAAAKTQIQNGNVDDVRCCDETVDYPITDVSSYFMK